MSRQWGWSSNSWCNKQIRERGCLISPLQRKTNKNF